MDYNKVKEICLPDPSKVLQICINVNSLTKLNHDNFVTTILIPKAAFSYYVYTYRYILISDMLKITVFLIFNYFAVFFFKGLVGNQISQSVILFYFIMTN